MKENNMLIAEFMASRNNWRAKTLLSGGFNAKVRNTVGNYHSSWLWLMPVLEEVMNVCESRHELLCHRFFIGITSINIKIEVNRRFFYFDAYYIEYNDRIEAFYKVMVEFINWYKYSLALSKNQ